MLKDIPPHIRLHKRPHPVPDNRHQILEPRPQQIAEKQQSHDQEKCPKLLLGQQCVHGMPCDIRKHQINQCNGKGKRHIKGKCLPMRFNIRSKDRKVAPAEINFSLQTSSLLLVVLLCHISTVITIFFSKNLFLPWSESRRTPLDSRTLLF